MGAVCAAVNGAGMEVEGAGVAEDGIRKAEAREERMLRWKDASARVVCEV